MALVSYSDSEGSDAETATQTTAPVAKPSFQRTEPRKIKVDLPAFQSEERASSMGEQPPAKRAKTAGSFGGFNSLLPAPKKAAPPTKTSLGKGVSLKTSSEAAFSRVPPPVLNEQPSHDDSESAIGESSKSSLDADKPKHDEVKLVGKATRFKPLSVANSKKKVPKKSVLPAIDEPKSHPAGLESQTSEVADPPQKEKKSLFSLQQDDTEALPEHNEADIISREPKSELLHSSEPPAVAPTPNISAASNSLESVASDMKLTPAQRRQLFGRQGKNMGMNVTNFNLDSEYASNEQMRQAGETIEHRAVKTIAPGKHSLQQLVNNARSNQDSIEDKWAEGRRNRGEGSSKYGW